MLSAAECGAYPAPAGVPPPTASCAPASPTTALLHLLEAQAAANDPPPPRALPTCSSTKASKPCTVLPYLVL